MSDVALLWFRLYHTRGLGAKRLHRIYQELQRRGRSLTEDDLLRLDAEAWRRKLRHQGIAPAGAVAAAYERLRGRDIRVVHLGHPAYPPLVLARLGDDAPPLLFCRGPLERLTVPSVAVVGARHAGERALAVAARLGHELARHGWNVLSGYAAGVDDQAHLGALRAGGTTTLVLSMGILRFDPRASLRETLGEEGQRVLVVSQFAPEAGWHARQAMTRNRLVCALAEAVVVVASGVHTPRAMSGTFDAGLTALLLGVPLFVVRPQALGSDPPPGNAELLARGGIALDPDDLGVFQRALPGRARVQQGGRQQLSLWT